MHSGDSEGSAVSIVWRWKAYKAGLTLSLGGVEKLRLNQSGRAEDRRKGRVDKAERWNEYLYLLP